MAEANVESVVEKLRADRQAREKARIEKLRELNLKKYSKDSDVKPSSSGNSFNKSIKIISNSNSMLHVSHARNSQFNKSRLSTAPGQMNKLQMKKPASNQDSSKRPSVANKNSSRPINNFTYRNKGFSGNNRTEKDVNEVTQDLHELNKDVCEPNIDNEVKDGLNTKDNLAGPSNFSISTVKNITTSSVSVSKTLNSKLNVAIKNDPKADLNNEKPAHNFKKPETTSNFINRNIANLANVAKKFATASDGKVVDKKTFSQSINNDAKMSRKSIASKPATISKPEMTRKSMQPQKNSKCSTESVFDRLYKPKTVPKKEISDVDKLRTDPEYLKKVIHDSGLIVNRRYTVFHQKSTKVVPARRSISAVHFKRVSKNELGNCIHKWSSVGEKLDKAHLEEINEDEDLKEEKIISAVKSERKKVQFQTPVPLNFNTPKPEELQAKLKNWLQKRGKSLDSYHHLQCFGIHHLQQNQIKPLTQENEMPKFDLDDDENKENIALDSDSDDGSYVENMDDRKNDNNDEAAAKPFDDAKWRRASYVSNSDDFNDTPDTTLSAEVVVHHHINELLLGALTDLTELLREGFDWEQCARWLRAVRERFPSAPETAAYWECRAALEERRGDLPASVQCWEEAIAKGTKKSVVESNLDQLLDKFMHLKISPNSGKETRTDSKLVDVKNVFKSTIIRFAVQQAKLRQSNQTEPPKYTVTPVRRCSRLSSHWSGKRTPLQVCSTVKQAGLIGETVFVPNNNLFGTP